MIRIESSVEIARPAAEVFAYVSDFSRNPEWQGGMQRCEWTTPGGARAGATYDQVARFLGREIRTSFEVTAFEPGRSVTITSTSGPFPIVVTRRVEASGTGTRVHAVVEGDPSGFFRLAAPLMRAMVKRSVDADYRRLRERLETEI